MHTLHKPNQAVSETTVQVFDCENFVLITGPAAPGKVAAHMVHYGDEIDDTNMVLSVVPGESAEELVCRFGQGGSEFREDMSEDMKSARDYVVAGIKAAANEMGVAVNLP